MAPAPVHIGVVGESSACEERCLIEGVGGVGTHVLQQLGQLQKTWSHIQIVLVCRSAKSYYLGPDRGLDLETIAQKLAASEQKALRPAAIVEFMAKCGPRAVLIDNTSSQEMVQVYADALHQGISIVTPNKKAFSGEAKVWDAIRQASWTVQQPSRGFLYHESTVGAGLPIISTLQDLVMTGDEIHRIEGVFSGTMSFLFNNFAPAQGSGGTWSQEVSKAKDAGYTEPDPRDDLNGMDVARKLVILARVADMALSGTQDITIESLIPEELTMCSSGEEFMQRLPQYDLRMDEVKSRAQAQNKLVRYMGSIDLVQESLKVGLQNVDHGHPVAGLKGSDNIVSFYTARYPFNPLVIQGAG